MEGEKSDGGREESEVWREEESEMWREGRK